MQRNNADLKKNHESTELQLGGCWWWVGKSCLTQPEVSQAAFRCSSPKWVLKHSVPPHPVSHTSQVLFAHAFFPAHSISPAQHPWGLPVASTGQSSWHRHWNDAQQHRCLSLQRGFPFPLGSHSSAPPQHWTQEACDDLLLKFWKWYGNKEVAQKQLLIM